MKKIGKKKGNTVMDDDALLDMYEYMLIDANSFIDIASHWMLETPAMLASRDLECNDGSKVKIYLVMDNTLINDHGDYYLFVQYENRYLEYRLHCDTECSSNWFQMMRDERVVEYFLDALHDIINGGMKYFDEHMEKEGILWNHSFAITEKKMDDVMKLPASCVFSVYGQVFHGVRDLENYCRIQKHDSSPYILKRCYVLPDKDQDDDYYGSRFSRIYLICESKNVAESYMKDFVGIGNFVAGDRVDFSIIDEFPPLIWYADRSRYMLLTYQKSYY